VPLEHSQQLRLDDTAELQTFYYGTHC
jgi:hypothetical protein